MVTARIECRSFLCLQRGKENVMIRGKTRAAALHLLVVGLTGSLLVAGCNKGKENGEGSPSGKQGSPPGGGGGQQSIAALLPGGEQYAAAKKVYADNNCARCHKLGDTGGGPGGGMKGGPPGGPPSGEKTKGGPPGGSGRGPELTKVGADPEHTTQWIADHIRGPKAHKPRSRMPAFGADKINDADLHALADYLASLK